MSASAELEAEQAKKRAALLRAYQQTFIDSPAGEMVLLDLLTEGGIFSTSFQSGDPHLTSFAEGRRSLVLTIIERLRWSAAELLQLAFAHSEPVYNAIAPEAGTDQPDLDIEGEF